MDIWTTLQERPGCPHTHASHPYLPTRVVPSACRASLANYRLHLSKRFIKLHQDGVRVAFLECPMRLISILNKCYHFPGFVYVVARINEIAKSIEIEVRSRTGSRGHCSICHSSGPTYDHLKERTFEFVPIWGFSVFFLYCMRRINCKECGITVEEVPWGYGKHHMTTAYVLFLANWAKKLSWKETALSFRTSWDKVCQAVEIVVQWGLEHRTLGPIEGIGVDEVTYAKGHKYLTLVYQIDAQCTRLLWIGKDRTVASFEKFFASSVESVGEFGLRKLAKYMIQGDFSDSVGPKSV